MITDISELDVKRLTARGKGLKKGVTIPNTPYNQLSENLKQMEIYRQDWDSMLDVRTRFRRASKFHRGDQWSDLIEDENGDIMTEDAYIRSQGKVPLKQNIIRPLAKSLAGLFRAETGKSIVISRHPNSANVEKMLSNALQYALQINTIREVDPRTFELFLLSGLPCQKVGYDFLSKYGRYDVMIDYIDPQYIFFNTDIKDIRLNDLRRIGQIHDVTMDDLIVNFAKNDADRKELERLYSGHYQEELISTYGLSANRGKALNFYVPLDPSKCRVVEVWEKKAVKTIEYWDKLSGEEGYWEGTVNDIIQINRDRAAKYQKMNVPEENWLLIHYDQTNGYKWFYKYLTPFGHVLREGETPYEHGSHPFVLYPYPLINGEVWGPIEDVIDQQKYINRLITLWDFIMGTSAKNTLVLDKNSLNGQKPEDIASDYRQVGGVLVLDFQGGKNKEPQELGGKMANLGITELIGMQLKWMQDISGVQPAMQGQTGASGTPASKYAMEIQQTTLNNRDLMESFASFRKERDMKVLRVVTQYYRSKRYLAISGKDDQQMYDPELLTEETSEFDLVIGQSQDSPTYKTWKDELLLDLVKNGILDLKMALPRLNAPWAEELLEDIKNQEEQMNAGQITPQQAASGINQSFLNKSGADPQQINNLSNMVNIA